MPNSSNNFNWSRSGFVRLMLMTGSSNICTLERAERTSRGRTIVLLVDNNVRESGRREPASTVSSKVRLSAPWSTSSENSSSCGDVISPLKASAVTGTDSASRTSNPFMSITAPREMVRKVLVASVARSLFL